MPTQEQIEAQASRRQQRAEARESAREQAIAESQALAVKSEQIAQEKAAGTFTEPPTKEKPLTRVQRKEIDKRRSEAQAKADAERSPAPVEIDLSKYRNGQEIPLHVLNALQAQTEKTEREEAVKLANAVGKVAFDEALGRRGRHGQLNRFRKMHQTEDRAAELTRQQAATE